MRNEARQVKIAGLDICQLCAMTVEAAARFFQELTLTAEESGIAGKLLEEIRDRLGFLNDVGLEYLTLDRHSSTLSGGEAQRIQLATSLGSRLVGTLYVLDEPSIGLHSRDTARLIHILQGPARSGKHDSGGGARPGSHGARPMRFSILAPARESMAGNWWPAEATRRSAPTINRSPGAT